MITTGSTSNSAGAPRLPRAGAASDACAACGRSSARALYEVRGYPIAKCTNCGLARTILPKGHDPLALYDAGYFQGEQEDGYANYVGSETVLRKEFRATIDRLAQAGVSSGSLLEVGCAYGYFLDEASKRFRVAGVEVAADARKACTDRGHEVVSEARPDWLEENGQFDAIVLLDVIEHLEDPAALLARIRPRVAAGGRLLITTGDFGSLSARITGRRWRLMTPPQHLWFFSPHALGLLLERSGFRLAEVEHPWKRVPLSLIAYQGLRLLGLAAPTALGRIPGSVPLNLFDAMRVIAHPI